MKLIGTCCLNFLVWIISYGTAYFLLHYQYRTEMNKYKFNSDYPEHSVVSKEIRLSAIAIIICSIYETLIINKKNATDTWTSVTDVSHKWVINPIIVLLFIDAHFYFYHKLLHLNKTLYNYIHKVHHESMNIDPFSGLSFHPIESCIYFSSLFITIPLDIPYWMFQFAKYGVVLAPLNGHSGHGNRLKTKIPFEAVLNSFDHYIHHALFNYNYGSGLFPIWDNIFGTAFKISQDEYFKKLQEK